MLKNYIKIAVKVLLRQKFFTVVSLFGISVTLTIIFVVVAMLDTIVTPGGRGSKLSRALFVEQIALEGEDMSIQSPPSYTLLDQHLRPLTTPEMVSIHSEPRSATVYVGGSKVDLDLKYTDAEFWDIIEMDFLEGGPYRRPQVDDADAVAVISQRTRNEVFDAGPVVGRFLETTLGTFRVVGVVPSDQMPGHTAYADLWVPITQSAAITARSEVWGSALGIVLPRKDGDSDAIKSEFEKHLNQVRAELSDKYHKVECPLASQLEMFAQENLGGGEGSGTLVIAAFIGLTILFMLLPAMNLVNMTISRIYERSSEIGVRKAFGAPASALVWQFVIENVVLTLVGGFLAVIMSLITLNILNASGVMPFAHFSLNLYVLFYSLITCLFFGVFSGVLPAYRMSRLHPVQALRGVTA